MSQKVHSSIELQTGVRITGLSAAVAADEPVRKSEFDALPSGGINKGEGVVDFGDWPGSTEAKLVVTGQTSISSTSIVQAWLMPKPTMTDTHSIDDQRLEPIKVIACDIVPGVGFTIYASIDQPLAYPKPRDSRRTGTGQDLGPGQQKPSNLNSKAGKAATLFDRYSVGWFWV
jgi:hypothetical protein